MSCSGEMRFPGSPWQRPGENAYVIARVCAGESLLHRLRSWVAQVGLLTSGPVQHPFLASGLPCPFHSCCQLNIPRASTSAYTGAMFAV